MTREAYEHWKGQPVEFLVRDIYLPDPVAVLSELPKGPTLKGIVVDLSDDARDERAAFVVVEVEGLYEPCIVAVERVRLVSDRSEPE